MTSRRLHLALTALALSSPFVAHAQSTTTGYVSGVVTDPAHATIAAATITLRNLATSLVLTARSANDGSYHIDFAPPGTYSLRIEAPGFSAQQQTVTVTVGQSATADAQLALGAASTTVMVSVEGAPLETENGNVSTSFNERQIERVPNPGQDLTYIAQVAPGAVMNTQSGGGNFSTFGLPGYSNMFTINGMDYLNSYGDNNKSGATNNSLGANEIQSVTVVNNGYSGNYGRLVGSNVNYVSKSGGNQLHGNAAYYWNGSSLNANDFFNVRSATPRPFDNVNQWADSIGGPIQKDRTFFFVNNEGLRIVLPTTSSVNIPSPQFEAATLANLAAVNPAAIPFYQQIFALYNAAPGASRAANSLPNGGCGTFTLPNGSPCALRFQAIPGNFTGEWLLSGRVDHIVSDRDQMFLHIFTDHGVQATSTNVINQAFDATSPQPEWQGQFNETHTFSPRAINQFVAAFQWSGILFGPANYTSTLAAFPAQLNISGGNFTTLGQNQQQPVGRHITQYQFVDDLSQTWGKHTLKAGIDFLRDDLNVFQFGNNTAGTLTTSLANFYNGQATSFTQSFPQRLHQPFAAYDVGFYVEDDWAITPHLKLTAALRFDREANTTCVTDCFSRLTAPFAQIDHDPGIAYNRAIQTGVSQAFYSATALSFEPRLGFAWSPFGGTTVIRGGVGNFRDFIPQQSLNGFALNSPNVNAFTVSGALSPASPGNVFANAAASNQAFLTGFAQGATLASLTVSDPAFAPPSFFGAQRKTVSPTYLEYNLEIDHSIGARTVLSANYVGNHGIHEVILDPSLNAYSPTPFAGLPSASPDARFSNVTEIDTSGTSNYAGLILTGRHSFDHGFQATASYAYSHALDQVSDNGFTAWGYGTAPSIEFPQNPANPRANYGNNDADVRHSFTGSYVWEPNWGAGLPVTARLLAQGWSLSQTFFERTGFPFTATDSSTTSALAATNYGGTVFANTTNASQPSCGNPDRLCLNAADFSVAGAGFGNQRRNQLRGPGFFNTDLSVLKRTRIRVFAEKQELAIGVNLFNALNHPNFDQPVADVANPQFGQIIRTVSPPTSVLGSGLGGDSSPRQIQLTAKFTF